MPDARSPPSEPHASAVQEIDFSITMQSEKTATLNDAFERLMDTIRGTRGLSIRGPIRLPKEGRVHSRRVDIRSIKEEQLHAIAAQSGIELSQVPGEAREQPGGVIVFFNVE
ncbi:hypothetical protein BGX31_007597 [Mortierella sp. GBA43]|nr:hypothetical protein BGX31_007597 [Mortierella sp. GBA43]